MMSAFGSINYLAVLLSGSVGYLLGVFWYSCLGFGKTWSNLMRLEETELSESLVSVTATIFAVLVTTLTLALIIQAFAAKTFMGGAGVGLLVGIGLISPSMFTDHLFTQWKWDLFLIQAGYRVCFVTLAGGILGFWR